MSRDALLAMRTLPRAVGCGPILIFLGVRNAWQWLAEEEECSAVSCGAEQDGSPS
jgi:hypothetical protein